jgi:uncharacterized protein YlaI
MKTGIELIAIERQEQIEKQTELIRALETSDWIMADKLKSELKDQPIANAICADCNEQIGNQTAHLCRKDRDEKAYSFVVNHKTLIYNVCHHHGNFNAGKNDIKLQELIVLARKEIGYSEKTWSGDIFNALINLYRRICV